MNPDTVKMLLATKVDVNTVLLKANGFTDGATAQCVKQLIAAGASAGVRRGRDLRTGLPRPTALDTAVKRSMFETAAVLHEAGGEFDEALRDSVHGQLCGNEAQVAASERALRLIVSMKINLNEHCFPHLTTAIGHACMQPPEIDGNADRVFGVVKLLLDLKATPKAMDAQGVLASTHAKSRGYVATEKLLLGATASV